jgi:sortase A
MRRRIGTILLLSGSAALIWCLTVLASAALYQWYEARRMEQQAPSTIVAAAPRPRLHDVIGLLRIPRLNISTVVLEGDDDSALRLGAGHVPWTALPAGQGNVGIAAHRDTFFRPLRNIAPNDRITLETPEGEFDYLVDSTEIVRPDAVRVLNASSHPELTLITCYPFYYVGAAPLRFIVHARLTAEPNPAARAHLPS